MQTTTEAIRRFRHSALGTYAAYVAHGLRHPTLLRSRATAEDRTARLDGDELVHDPDWITDFVTDIDAAPADVWPWLVQMGYGRAGYYAWYRYDNGGVASADVIVPELQRLAVGDLIPDGPRARDGFGVWRVVELAPQRTLVLHSRRHPWTGEELPPTAAAPFITCSWAFVLRDLGAERSHLHVRVRAAFHAGRGSRAVARLARALLGFGDSVMENTMLDGIRERAEAKRSA